MFIVDFAWSIKVFNIYWIYSTDKASEAAILEVVKKNFSDHLILGEEGGIIGDSSSDYLWCIDPLGFALFTNLIAFLFMCVESMRFE